MICNNIVFFYNKVYLYLLPPYILPESSKKKPEYHRFTFATTTLITSNTTVISNTIVTAYTVIIYKVVYLLSHPISFYIQFSLAHVCLFE